MHIYESSSMVLGPLPAVSSWQRGIFSFGSEWSQPSSHHFTTLSSHYFRRRRHPHLETAFLKVGILALSLLRKDQTCLSDHVTTYSQVLKHFYIRPPLSLPSFSSLPPQWTFSKGCLVFEWRRIGNGTFIVPQWWKWIWSSGAAIETPLVVFHRKWEWVGKRGLSFH